MTQTQGPEKLDANNETKNKVNSQQMFFLFLFLLVCFGSFSKFLIVVIVGCSMVNQSKRIINIVRGADLSETNSQFSFVKCVFLFTYNEN